MKKNLKKQIKQDELVTWFEQARGQIQERMDQVRIGLIVLSVLAVGAAALAYFRAQRDREARAEFAVAPESFHAPVATDTTAAMPAAGSRFATQAEKYRQAMTQFEGVARRYASHPIADRARYYAALCHIELNELDQAEALLKPIAAQRAPERMEPDLARLALADVQRRKGQFDQAADTFKQVVDDERAAVPRDHALMSLAQLFEQARKLEEAQAAYVRLTQEFPSSAYASEAQRRIEYLKARG